MNLHENLWKAFSGIFFDNESHTYTDIEGNIYTSGTSFVKEFTPTIDWEKIKEKKAKKLGITTEALSNEWKYKSKYATTIGTELHAVLENLWNKKNYNGNVREMGKFDGMNAEFSKRKEECVKIFNALTKVYTPIATELVIYDYESKLAGTIDFLAYNAKKDTYHIIDWKSSKKIETQDVYDHKKLNTPFSEYEYCNFNEYSIQLSTYKYILEKNVNIKIDSLILVKIPTIDELTPTVMKCNDMSEIIKQYINEKIMKV